MAGVLNSALYILLFFTILQVRKWSFVSADPVGLCVIGLEISEPESFIFSSLWQASGSSILGVRASKQSLITILILMCGDIHPCPGPGNDRNVPELNVLLQERGMKVFHQNVRGLSSNSEHVLGLLQNSNGIDVLSLSETHLCNQDTESLFYIPGYEFINKPRQTGKGGGVAMYISNSVVWKRREDLENNNVECIWIEIVLNRAKNFLIGIYYRPPDGSKYLHSEFNTILNDTLELINIEEKEAMILGDFNVNFLAKNNHAEFKAILNIHGFKQIIKKPTRVTCTTKTLIDIILSNKPEFVKLSDVIPLSIGDHDLIGCVRKINHIKFKSKSLTCRNYKHYDSRAFSNQLRSVDWSLVYDNVDVHSAWLYMKTVIMGIFNKHAPLITKRVKGKPAPWLTAELKSLMNERDSLLRKYRKSKNTADFQAYKQKRNLVNCELRRAKLNYNRNLLNENMDNPRSFWKIIKRLYPIKSPTNVSGQSFDLDGERTVDAVKICEGFSNFFANVVINLKRVAFPLRDFIWRSPLGITCKTNSLFKFRPVSSLEVFKILKSIKCAKSTGIDGIPPRLLRDAANAIASPLAHIINLSMELGQIPSEWKSAKIIPIYKAGPKSDMGNYRPISILPVVSKVIERTVHTQLMKYMTDNSLLYKHQFGFRPRMSTELAAIKLIDDIRSSVDKGNLVGALFIDLSKAFDTISHAQLLTKLPQYGIKDIELEWFTDYLFCRTAYVSYDGHISSKHYITCGVPQGSILGPLLFLISFNDIVDSIEHCNVIKYADDVVLYTAGKDIESIKSRLSGDMLNISHWLEENELILNLKQGKTESLLFGTAKRRSVLDDSLLVSFNDTRINSTEEYTYLGVQIGPTLNMHSQFDATFKKATSRLRLLSKIRPNLNVNAAKAIYNCMILPILTYCGVLNLNLTQTQLNKLTSLQERATKVVFLNGTPEVGLQSVTNCKKKRACELVKKIVVGDICDSLKDHFTLNNHVRVTRNNGFIATLPKVKTEYGRRSFAFMGARIFNELPLNIRKTDDIKSFSAMLLKHFS